MPDQTVAAPAAVLLGAVLLPQDIEIGIDAVVGDGLAPQQFMEVFPFGLKSVVGVLAGGDDVDKLVDDLKTSLHF